MAENSLERALMIVRAAQARRALDVVILDMRPLMTLCDYFVITHGRSAAHIRAITEDILEDMKQQQISPHHREGRGNERWAILDYTSVVVHIFSDEARTFYALERLWGDADRIKATAHNDR